MAVRELDVWVMVDESGSYVVSSDCDKLQEMWDEEVGDESKGTRVLQITLNVDMPEIVPIVVNVPAIAGAVTLTVK